MYMPASSATWNQLRSVTHRGRLRGYRELGVLAYSSEPEADKDSPDHDREVDYSEDDEEDSCKSVVKFEVESVLFLLDYEDGPQVD